jgi:ubiquinol-cytochrome c reductase cytochrome b subunit
VEAKDTSIVLDSSVLSFNALLEVETFSVVNNIAKENGYGAIIRDTHVVGASTFMFLIIIHVIRNIDSRGHNRVSVRMWLSGVLMIVLSMGIAFTGYVLL